MDIFIGALIFTSIMLTANTLALMNMTMQTNKTREILEKISESLSKTNNNEQ